MRILLGLLPILAFSSSYLGEIKGFYENIQIIEVNGTIKFIEQPFKKYIYQSVGATYKPEKTKKKAKNIDIYKELLKR